MKIDIAIATFNKNKFREITNIIKSDVFRFYSLDNFGPIPPIIENGRNFEENAYIKSSMVAKYLGIPSLSDDSGLVVEALNGAPGVYTSRYAGTDATDNENIRKLLNEIKLFENKNAFFECVISLCMPSGEALTYIGKCHGMINSVPIGNNGFGYDPIFYYSKLKKTFAQLTDGEKNSVSHRGIALIEFMNEISKIEEWVSTHTNTEKISNDYRIQFIKNDWSH